MCYMTGTLFIFTPGKFQKHSDSSNNLNPDSIGTTLRFEFCLTKIRTSKEASFWYSIEFKIIIPKIPYNKG